MSNREYSDPIHERISIETRKERVNRLNGIVDTLFPGEEQKELRENIARSFLVPQVGDYHHEGSFMDSHLDLILQNIENVKQGHLPEELSPVVRKMLKRAVEQDPESVEKYVFLHDISKADCLTIKVAEEEHAISWQEWTEMLAGDEMGRLALQGDEDSFRAFIDTHKITSIAYWQKIADGNRQHGNEGSRALIASGMEAGSSMLVAIETHEVAYNFNRINVKTYESFFGEMSSEVRDFALLASYVDTMSSLRADGKPDLANFMALAGSREKFESMVLLAERLQSYKLDKQKFDRAWAELRSSSDPLTQDMLDNVEEKLKQECKIAGYDIDRLRNILNQPMRDGHLTQTECDELLILAETDPQGIGKKFGPKMRIITPLLKEALV